jgi:cobyrinic acid a,c-diamide synthase
VVALAHDEALNCYFPDTLDVLEARGATIVDFSPLRDERLPADTDIVYLGCGHPERYAERLSENDCMRLALRNHLRAGGRIYAEGGGLAYLCEQMELPCGGFSRMVGIFPAVARINPHPQKPVPVELTLNCDTWLGNRGTRVQGYRTPCWRLESVGALSGCVAEDASGYDLVQSGRAVGSCLHLDFAAATRLLPGFFQRDLGRVGRADPWAVVS